METGAGGDDMGTEEKKQLCGTGDIICDTLGVTNSDIFSNKIR